VLGGRSREGSRDGERGGSRLDSSNVLMVRRRTEGLE